ncbi:hypothetical protein HK096_008449, partial [Nowakowskiella sp. JEL0078]
MLPLIRAFCFIHGIYEAVDTFIYSNPKTAFELAKNNDGETAVDSYYMKIRDISLKIPYNGQNQMELIDFSITYSLKTRYYYTFSVKYFIEDLLDNPRKWFSHLKDLENAGELDYALSGSCINLSEHISHHFNFLFEELEHISNNRLSEIMTSPSKSASPTSSHGVFLADGLIEDLLGLKFQEHVATLENLAHSKHNWQHQSNNQIFDLIHPSLNCLIYNRTRCSKRENAFIGEEKAEISSRTKNLLDYVQKKWLSSERDIPDVSSKFQWLPSEFNVSEFGEVTIKSYINNLNVKETKIYCDIAAIFQRMLPLFERSVASLNTLPFQRIEVEDDDELLLYSWNKNKLIWAFSENNEELYHQLDWFKIPIPPLPKFFSPKLQTDPIYSLKGKNLQVIVKMSNIELTPENPVFQGGNWHIEGMENEAIAATGIYYYSIKNITQSRLQFRNTFEIFSHSAQDEFQGLGRAYNFVNESDNVQISGNVVAMEGRCVTFPNFHHHRLEPFELLDKTQPGHRKILAFFLVHPKVTITSTKHIPPQQKDWV